MGDVTDGKASAYNAGDQGLIPVLGRSPGKGNGNLVWTTPWTKEHGRLQPMESQRAGRDRAHTARVCIQLFS